MTIGLKGAGEEFFQRLTWETDLARPSNVTVGMFNDSYDDLNDINNIGAITTEPTGSSYARRSVSFGHDVSVDAEHNWFVEFSDVTFARLGKIV
jgi:hypothetical protein